MTFHANWLLRKTLAMVSCCTGAERIDAMANGSATPRFNEEAGEVRKATLAVASY